MSIKTSHALTGSAHVSAERRGNMERSRQKTGMSRTAGADIPENA